MAASEGGAAWASAPQQRIRADAEAKGQAVSEIPVVDLSEPDDKAALDVKAACLNVGFFYVRNHGVSDALVQRQFAASRAFFALPLEQKMRLRADATNRGYYPFGMGSAKNPFQQCDRKEAFNIYGFEDDNGTIPFHGRNKWPAEALAPGFRETMDEYYAGMQHVACRILRLIALALDLPATYFDDKFSHPVGNVRAVHYAGSEAANPSRGVFGVGPHTDWGALTVLATDAERGLQICLGGRWLDVDPRPGHFVVNLGDMIDRWTNGRFRSTLHRVVNHSERYSTPFFLAANWDTEISVLPGCDTPAAPAQYAPVTCGAWLTSRRAAEYGRQTRVVEDSPRPAQRLAAA